MRYLDNFAAYCSNCSRRLKRRLFRDQVPDTSRMENRLQKDSDFTSHIETGFQLATFQGPLCAEPVEGLAYFVEDVQVDIENLEKEIGACFARME